MPDDEPKEEPEDDEFSGVFEGAPTTPDNPYGHEQS